MRSPGRSWSWARLKHRAREAVRGSLARQNRGARARLAGDDAALLAAALHRLKTTGAIEYTGEYGAELTTFLPFAFWLKTQGLLSGRRVVTYRGMRPYYYFLEDEEIAEKSGARQWLEVNERTWPSNSTWRATRRPWHVMPDYRSRYRAQGMTFSRPVLFIQNKFTVEASRGPINYLPIQALETLFSRTADRFDVIYSRPRTLPQGAGYTVDHNDHCDYPDLGLARRFDHVRVLEDLCVETGAPYNLTKLQIAAKSRLFVAVQGGGAHLLASFGDSLLLLLHYHGHEYPHAYALGPYKYLSSPAPTLMLARAHAELEHGVALMSAIQARDGDLWLDRSTLSTLRKLRF